MSRSNRPDTTDHAEGFDRIRVARLLREARHDPAGSWADIDWAYAAIPESDAARRLKIKALLQQGDTEAADALIALGLLHRPTDPGLSLLSAMSLYRQDRLPEADRTIRLVLPRRAHHITALALAGRIASGLGHHDRAADLLGRAHQHRPGDVDITSLLIESLLAIGQVDSARKLLDTCSNPPVILKAQVLQAQGAGRTALALLDGALANEKRPEKRESLLQMLINLLDADDDHPRLLRLAKQIDAQTPQALLQVSRVILALGKFELVQEKLQTLSPAWKNSLAACEISLVAHAMTGDMSQADQGYLDLECKTRTIDRHSLAECWRRGLLGRLLREQQTTIRSASDPNPGFLVPLTRKALAIFEKAIHPVSRSDSIPDELTRHREVCLALLGERQGRSQA